jgi:hypothetical protein
MRTITLICVLLTLSACKEKKDKVRPDGRPAGADDSSPIIIADASVHIHQTVNFTVNGKKETIALPNHKPTILYYQCDPDPQTGNCRPVACTSSAQPNCQVDLTMATDWSLNLLDTSTAGTLTWKSNKPEKVEIELPKGFSVKGENGNRVDLTASADYLLSAKLTIDGTDYNFACTRATTCLTVGYYCPDKPGAPCN